MSLKPVISFSTLTRKINNEKVLHHLFTCSDRIDLTFTFPSIELPTEIDEQLQWLFSNTTPTFYYFLSRSKRFELRNNC